MLICCLPSSFFYLASTVTNVTQNKRYFFISHSFHSSHLIHVEEMKTNRVIIFVNCCLFQNICARSRKVTKKIATPKEVNTPFPKSEKKFSLSIEKMDSFLKTFRMQLFYKVLDMVMLQCSSLKFIICDIYNMFFAILTHYLTQILFIF